jgi:hypothetical protein
VDVSFADPEDAVRERVEEMALSEAARDVDEAVRADTLPDSNVRETVKGRVEERIDDLDAFAGGGAGDNGQGDGEGGETDEGGESDGGGDGEADVDSDEEDAGVDPDETDEEDAEGETSGTDGQVSMEDYL